MINYGSEFINYKQFTEICVQKAVEIRNKIEKSEKKLSVTRGDSPKIGFPKKDPKSQQRFINFYIGNLKTNDTISGILGDLELIVIKKIITNNIPSLVIGVTEYGFQFSKLYSPLIDGTFINQKGTLSSLSNEEISFLIHHLKKIRSVDYEFLNHIYTVIKNGNNQPSELSNFVSDY